MLARQKFQRNAAAKSRVLCQVNRSHPAFADKTSLVTTQSIVTGVFTQWGNINPNTSTGRFAGVTGVIFFNGIPIGDPSIGPYKSVIVGEICFAHDDDEEDDENDDDR